MAPLRGLYRTCCSSFSGILAFLQEKPIILDSSQDRPKCKERETSLLEVQQLTWNHMPSNFRLKTRNWLSRGLANDWRRWQNDWSAKWKGSKTKKRSATVWLHGRAEEARMRLLLCQGLVKCPDIQNCGVLWQSTLQWRVLKGPTLHGWWSDGRVGRRWWTNRVYMLFTAVRRWSSLTPITLLPDFFVLFKFQHVFLLM